MKDTTINSSKVQRSFHFGRKLLLGCLLPVAWYGCNPLSPMHQTQPLATVQGENLAEEVTAKADYPGKMAASEVIIRGLSPRPRDADDPHNTLKAIKGFHATRLEWIYELTPEFIQQVQSLGTSVSGTTSTSTGVGLDKSGPEWRARYSILDLNLQPTTAPWMRKWAIPGLWLCVNNPDSREASLAHGKLLIDQGVLDIQRDDPAANQHAVKWGACFCPACMSGFRDYLQENATSEQLAAWQISNLDTFDYREYLLVRDAPVGDAFQAYASHGLTGLFQSFQTQSTTDFHKWWHEEINQYAGRYVPVSSNNVGRLFGPTYQPFDFWIGELNIKNANPEFLFDLSRRMYTMGKGQTLTMPLKHSSVMTPEWLRTIRNSLATIYAVGMHMEAPWDTYLPTPQADRYFGEPKDFSDLLGFIRANAALLDGYESAAAIGSMIQDDRWPDLQPATTFPPRSKIAAFLRVKPDQPEAPIVMHLVDWSANPKAFEVSLRPELLFNGRPFKVTLITPLPYEQAAHELAFESRDYSKLVAEQELGSGFLTTMKIPALHPWGILRLVPLPSTEAVPAVWAPSISTSLLEAGDHIILSVATKGARIVYTLDGSEPTINSIAYTTPLTYPATACTLRAKAFAGERSSTETQALLLPPSPPPTVIQQAVKNAEFQDGLKDWSVIVADGSHVSAQVESLPSDPESPAVRLQVERTTAQVIYQLRLAQALTIPASSKMEFSGTLESDKGTSVRVGLQGAKAPNPVICMETVVLQPGIPSTFRLEAIASSTDLDSLLQIDFGLSPAGTQIWISQPKLKILVPHEAE